tara:strand:+ start:4946 stop:6079 length:1134 start_codon:yes stop_codon:yes gene_type:complete
MSAKLPFAESRVTGKMVSVVSVPSGLACNCVCPGCGSDLVAKKGTQTTHHFAHHSTEACRGGLETALHQMMKQVIENKRQVIWPEEKGTVRIDGEYGNDPITMNSYEIPGRGVKTIKNLQVEKADGPYIPDIQGVIDGQKIWIEVMVTHACTDEKLAWAQNHNRAVLQISLGRICNFLHANPSTPADEVLAALEAVIEDQKSVSQGFYQWLVNGELKAAKDKAKAALDVNFPLFIKDMRKKRRQYFFKTNEWLRTKSDSDRFSFFERTWSWDRADWPACCDIDIDGAFDHDRKLWQAQTVWNLLSFGERRSEEYRGLVDVEKLDDLANSCLKLKNDRVKETIIDYLEALINSGPFTIDGHKYEIQKDNSKYFWSELS